MSKNDEKDNSRNIRSIDGIKLSPKNKTVTVNKEQIKKENSK